MPKPLSFEELAAQARKLVFSLGISLYVRDGRIWQFGPGERFDPEPIVQSCHGWNTRAGEETAP
jgi:hypothetical protein